MALCLLSWGCMGPDTLLELTTQDPADDHQVVASFYHQEAEMLRQKAADLHERAVIYDTLFGPESEWASGTRALARFYEQMAADRDREAQIHRDLAAASW